MPKILLQNNCWKKVMGQQANPDSRGKWVLTDVCMCVC